MGREHRSRLGEQGGNDDWHAFLPSFLKLSHVNCEDTCLTHQLFFLLITFMTS